MGEPVKIIVTAETAQAAAALQAFVQQASSGLKTLAPAGAAAASSLTQVRETAMLTHEGFRTLSASAMLLGGTRFPELSMGVMGVTQGLRALRTAAMLTGLGMSELLIPIAAIGAVIATGAFIWHEFSSGEAAAAKEAKNLEEALGKVPALLEKINALRKGGRIGPGEAGVLQDYLTGKPGKNKLYVQPDGSLGPNRTTETEVPSYQSMPTGGLVKTGSQKITSELTEASPAQYQKYSDDLLSGKGGINDPAATEASAKMADLREKANIAFLDGIEKKKAAIHDEFQKQREEIEQTRIAEGTLEGPNEKKDNDYALAQLDIAEGNAITAAEKKAAAESDKATLEVQKSMDEYLRADEDLQKSINEQIANQLQAQKKIQELKYANTRSAIEGNPDLSQPEKATAMLAVNQAEQQFIALQIQENALDEKNATSQEEKNKFIEQGLQLQGQSIALQNKQLQLEAQSGNWGAAFKVAAAGVKEWNQSLALTVASGSLNLLQQGIHGMASALTSVIIGSKSAAQAFAELGKQMVESFISMILDIVMVAVVAIPILTALGVLSGGSIPTAGAAATISSVGEAQGAVGDVMLAAQGGYITGPGTGTSDSIPAMLSNGEYVFPASAVDRIGVDNLAALHRGDQGGFSGLDRGQSSGASREQKTEVLFFMDRQELMNHLKSSAAEKIIISHVFNNRLRVGIKT
jgi:hypothetical protein